MDVHVNIPFLASFRSRVLQRRHNATAQAPTIPVPQAPPMSVMIHVWGQSSYPLFSHCSASCPIMTASAVVPRVNSLLSGHFLRTAPTGIRLTTDSNSTLKDDQSRARCCCSREQKLIDLGGRMVGPLWFHRLFALWLPLVNGLEGTVHCTPLQYLLNFGACPRTIEARPLMVCDRQVRFGSRLPVRPARPASIKSRYTALSSRLSVQLPRLCG